MNPQFNTKTNQTSDNEPIRLTNFDELFTKRIFIVPDYQRGYSWTDVQLADFWNDVANSPDDTIHYTGMVTLRRLADDKVNRLRSDYPAFRILEKQVSAWEVVDGQQRITTFLLFLKAYLLTRKSLDRSFDENPFVTKYFSEQTKYESLSILSYDGDTDATQRLKWTLDNSGVPVSTSRSFYTKNLDNALSRFTKWWTSFSNRHGSQAGRLMDAFFRRAEKQFLFNVYFLPEEFDIHATFESMNNRGKSLSNLELLKNRLFYLVHLMTENRNCEDKETEEREESAERAEADVVRKHIFDAWKNIYSNLGRGDNPLPDDDLLRDHWIARFVYNRTVGKACEKFLLKQLFSPARLLKKSSDMTSSVTEEPERIDNADSIGEDEDEVPEVRKEKLADLTLGFLKEYVDDLGLFSYVWAATFNPDKAENCFCSSLGEEERSWVNRLNRLGMAYFRPLVATILGKIPSGNELRIQTFRQIELFIFRAFRIGKSRSNFGQSEVCRSVRNIWMAEDKITACDALNDLLGQDRPWRKAAEDAKDDFKRRIKDMFENNRKNEDGEPICVGFYGWNGLRYFFFEYEHSLREDNNARSPKLNPDEFFKSRKKNDKISIEHIFPQTPDNADWNWFFRAWPGGTCRSHLAGMLGNLLPLSQSINSSLQNKSFADKKNPADKKERKGYSFGCCSEVEVAQETEWTPEKIKKRTKHLLDWMIDHWEILPSDTDKNQYEDDLIAVMLKDCTPLPDNDPRVNVDKDTFLRTFNVPSQPTKRSNLKTKMQKISEKKKPLIDSPLLPILREVFGDDLIMGKMTQNGVTFRTKKMDVLFPPENAPKDKDGYFYQFGIDAHGTLSLWFHPQAKTGGQKKKSGEDQSVFRNAVKKQLPKEVWSNLLSFPEVYATLVKGKRNTRGEWVTAFKWMDTGKSSGENGVRRQLQRLRDWEAAIKTDETGTQIISLPANA